jgi:hypothetical protein
MYVQTHAGRDDSDRPLSAYSDLLDPLYLLSTPSLNKGLGSGLYHSSSHPSYSSSSTSTHIPSSSSFPSHSHPDFDLKRKNEKQKEKNMNDKNFRENTIAEIYQNGSNINGNLTEEYDEKSEDDVKINFTQFFYLLLEITEIVYPEIYTDPGSELYLNSSVTGTGTSRTNSLGKTRAFQKILIVSKFN